MRVWLGPKSATTKPAGDALSPGEFFEFHRQGKQMAAGSIKKLTDKGFGFIKTDSEKDLFFHSKSVQGTTFDQLYEGQAVTYTAGSGPKGPCAENVKPA